MTLRQCYLELAVTIITPPNPRLEEEFKKASHITATPITPDMPVKKARSSQVNIKVNYIIGNCMEFHLQRIWPAVMMIIEP